VVASTGVSQYITAAALSATRRHLAELPRAPCFACTFVLPASSINPAERELRARTGSLAAGHGAPWISAYEPDQIRELAQRAGFAGVAVVGPRDWNARYFAPSE
jgi:O-methyltransferase involved in polyketide biosynthesis